MTALAIGTSSHLWLRNDVAPEKTLTTTVEPKPAKPTIYPKLYSDTHITQNAIVTDERFANSVVYSGESQVASVLSSISVQTNKPTSRALESGTWLWTPIMEITPKYRNSIISGARKNGIKNIYLSIDSYLDIFIMPDGVAKDAKKKAFDAVIEGFIKEARKNGITVDAEGGWRNWAEKGNEYKPFAVLGYAIQYNRTHTEKFRGFQYDVEPYLLDSYKKDKAKVLTNFLTLVNESVSKLNKSDLTLSVVIPEFYDGSNGETPEFKYLGRTGHAIDHLLTVLDRRPGSDVIIMAYRNVSFGDNGAIDISADEVSTANEHKSRVVIAQETGDFQPPYITFHNTSKKYYKRQVSGIEKTLADEKSYGGIATHYINAYLTLK